jgi:hypothetical protein
VIISMPELVVLRVVNGMSADRAVEVGADALSYPTTTRPIPTPSGPLDGPVQPWPARLIGPGFLTMTLASPCVRLMMIALDGIVSRDCTTPVVAAVADRPLVQLDQL